VSEARTLWEEGHEPGGQVAALGLALAFTVVTVDVVTGGGVGVLYDAGFVVLCVAVALLVRPQDFFTVGVLPPLVMLVVVTVLAIAQPAAMAGSDASDDSLGQAILAGLAHHCVALAVGYALCLGVLAVRDRVLREAVRR
jgi:hypothetical protein